MAGSLLCCCFGSDYRKQKDDMQTTILAKNRVNICDNSKNSKRASENLNLITKQPNEAANVDAAQVSHAEQQHDQQHDQQQLLPPAANAATSYGNDDCWQTALLTKFTQNKNKNEIEQSLAAAISDRATDEVLEALTRYRRGLGIADSPSIMLDEPQTPDIVRSRSSHDPDGILRPGGRGSILPKMGLESPTATPHLPNKRRSVALKIRPQSVVENLSLGHIPDLLESPSSHRSSNTQMLPRSETLGCDTVAEVGESLGDELGGDECCDSITELPSASFQLQHLVKGRPKRPKTRAPSRPMVAVEAVGALSVGVSSKELGEGLEQFFRPGSVTPTTLTPLVSPTSEECSSLSFVDSPTMSRDGNGQMTSEETTPILEERRPIKLDRSSPLLKGTWTTRSRSTDNLEKYSPLVGRKSPLVKMRNDSCGAASSINPPTSADEAVDRLLRSSTREERMHSPSSDSIKSHSGSGGGNDNSVIVKNGNSILRTPIVLQKPRPWSVVGSNEPKNSNSGEFNANDSNKTTPEKLDDDCEVLPFGSNNGGSIVGITPGIAIAAGGSGGGSIVGITPGAALEKKSVRELAAGLSRMDLPLKPKALPRNLLNSSISAERSSMSSNASSTSSTENSNTESVSSSSTTTTTTNTVTARSRITSSSSINSETNEVLSKTVISQNMSKFSSGSTNSNSNSRNEVLSIRNGNSATSILNEINKSKIVLRRIAGKEISTAFEGTLVEGLQRSASSRNSNFREETQYTKEDVVDL